MRQLNVVELYEGEQSDSLHESLARALKRANVTGMGTGYDPKTMELNVRVSGINFNQVEPKHLNLIFDLLHKYCVKLHGVSYGFGDYLLEDREISQVTLVGENQKKISVDVILTDLAKRFPTLDHVHIQSVDELIETKVAKLSEREPIIVELMRDIRDALGKLKITVAESDASYTVGTRQF